MGIQASFGGGITQEEWDAKLMTTTKTLADLDPTRANKVDNIEGENVEILQMPKLNAPPTPAGEGDMYYDTTSNTYKYYNGSTWVTVRIQVTEL